MDEKKRFLVFSLIFLVLLIIPIVYGRSVIEDAFSVFEGLNVGEFYAGNAMWVDAVLYFIIFIGTAQFALGERFKERGGRAVQIGMGIALAFSMTYYSYATGFNLGKLAPWAVVIFVIWLAGMIYGIVKQFFGKFEGSNLFAISVAYILGWFVLMSMLPGEVLASSTFKPILPYFHIGLVIAIILLIWAVITWIRERGGVNLGNERGHMLIPGLGGRERTEPPRGGMGLPQSGPNIGRPQGVSPVGPGTGPGSQPNQPQPSGQPAPDPELKKNVDTLKDCIGKSMQYCDELNKQINLQEGYRQQNKMNELNSAMQDKTYQNSVNGLVNNLYIAVNTLGKLNMQPFMDRYRELYLQYTKASNLFRNQFMERDFDKLGRINRGLNQALNSDIKNTLGRILGDLSRVKT